LTDYFYYTFVAILPMIFYCHQSLHVIQFELISRKVHTDVDTNLSFNQIMEEFYEPWGTEARKKG
jgi:hypothetical protein